MVQNLTWLKKCLILTHFVFVQIHKLYGYGQYKMHGNVINVSANMNQTQLILAHVSHVNVTICVFLKWHLEYKLPYMLRYVCPNMVMVGLQDIIETPLYKDLNVTIHHQ